MCQEGRNRWGAAAGRMERVPPRMGKQRSRSYERKPWPRPRSDPSPLLYPGNVFAFAWVVRVLASSDVIRPALRAAWICASASAFRADWNAALSVAVVMLRFDATVLVSL